MSRQATRELLLSSLNPDGSAFANRSDTDWEEIDWDWLLERARFHKIAALFVGRMDQHRFTELLPAQVQNAFVEVRDLAVDRTAKARHTLEMLTQLYDELSIPFMLVKGSALSEQVYGDPHLRPFYDVDLVLLDEHIDKAEQALLERGYFFLKPTYLMNQLDGDAKDLEGALRRLAREKRHNLEMVLKENDPRLPVELHWHIASPGVLKVDEGGLWEQASTVNISGFEVKTLNLEAMLIHTSVHAMEQSLQKFRLMHLCDVVWIIEKLGASLSEDSLLEIARSWGAERHLFSALKAAETIFPFPVPDATRYSGMRSSWSEGCLRQAGFGPQIADEEPARSDLGRLARRVWRETFFDFGFRRSPKRANALIADTFSAASARLRGRHDG